MPKAVLVRRGEEYLPGVPLAELKETWYYCKLYGHHYAYARRCKGRDYAPYRRRTFKAPDKQRWAANMTKFGQPAH